MSSVIIAFVVILLIYATLGKNTKKKIKGKVANEELFCVTPKHDVGDILLNDECEDPFKTEEWEIRVIGVRRNPRGHWYYQYSKKRLPDDSWSMEKEDINSDLCYIVDKYYKIMEN